VRYLFGASNRIPWRPTVTVADPFVIDGVLASPDEQTYVILMTEDRPFRDSTEQIDQLVEKINTYASYIESGQLWNDHPRARGKRLEVLMVCWDPPEQEEYRELVHRAAVLFSALGAELHVEVLSLALVGS
jgi:hypothetical protein